LVTYGDLANAWCWVFNARTAGADWIPGG